MRGVTAQTRRGEKPSRECRWYSGTFALRAIMDIARRAFYIHLKNKDEKEQL